MFEIFVALFGGAYWAGKIGADKRKSKRADVRLKTATSQYRASMQSWEERVTDFTLEMELKEMLSDITNSEYVYGVVSDVYEEIGFVLPPKEMFRCTRKLYNERCLQIMLAKQGKLTKHDAHWGIRKEDGSDKVIPRLVRWIQEQLKKHGINENIYLDGGISFQPRPAFLQDEYDNGYCGDYMWAPSVYQK